MISALMITTNVASRLHLLDNTIQSIEKANDNLFDHKVLSIDVLPDHPFDLEYFKKYEALGWEIVYGPCSGHRGMCNNILRGLGVIPPSDYIYYVEDDVIINRLPSRDCFELFTKSNIGFACFNTHISDTQDHGKINYINNKDNYVKYGEELFLLKDTIIKDEYYLNFPSAFVNDFLFRELINYAAASAHGLGMEPGLTKAWFDTGYYLMYKVAIYVKPDALSSIPFNLQSFHKVSNMQFWNNDETLRHPSINNRNNTIF